MATIKSYTDLEQSKKLAEILPLESADMWWSRCTIADFGDGILKISYSVEPCNISQFRNTNEDIPCWSLSALLSALTYPEIKQCYDGKWACRVENKDTTYLWVDSKPIDACVAVIEKLHEENIL